MATKGKGKGKVTKCQKCGKTLGTGNTTGIGHLCALDLTAHMYYISAIPKGYAKVSDVHTWCNENNIPVARMVKYFGRDRGVAQPLCYGTASVYYGHTRYCHLTTMQSALLGKPYPKGAPAGLQAALGNQWAAFALWVTGDKAAADKAAADKAAADKAAADKAAADKVKEGTTA